MLVQQFKDFVANQPADDVVNHASWIHCACGVFARSLNGPQHISSYAVAEAVKDMHGHEAYMILGNGGANHYGKQLVDISTYGKLSVWLNSLI